MRIALAQINLHVGNFSSNKRKIKEYLLAANESGADLVVFPELTVCGYPPKDLLEYTHFVKESIETIEELALYCKGIAALIGGPAINPFDNGKMLHNSAFFLEDGKVRQVFHKGLLPTYDVFDESRYFEPAKHFDILEFKGRKIAVTICEDIWDKSSSLKYTNSPMEILVQKNPELIINMAASPFHIGQQEEREEIIFSNCQRFGLPVFYINQIGAQTDLLFDGNSMVFDSEGKKCYQLAAFKEELALFDFTISNDDAKDFTITSLNKTTSALPQSKAALHFEALVMGIKEYFEKSGFSKAILGLSGGIDSAIVSVLAEKALGKENILAVLMPSQYSSQHSIDDSLQLAKQLGIDYEIIDIKNIFNAFEEGLSKRFENTPFGLAEENLQSRSRGVVLMALSNKSGHVLLNTTNKSEMAVGYGTLYGDMCGALSVIGDLYKTEVYELAEYINQEFGMIIPPQILSKAPSAELRPDQKDSDSLPEYAILDKILQMHIEEKKGEELIIANGFDSITVRKTLTLVQRSEFKRFQAPPVLRVSKKAFGSGRRIPLEASYTNNAS